jgi:hypothetical protein
MEHIKLIIFYAHHSVHRESNPKKFQQDDTLVQYFINSCKSLYVFRVKQSPIIRSSIKLYLQNLVLTECGLPSSWMLVFERRVSYYTSLLLSPKGSSLILPDEAGGGEAGQVCQKHLTVFEI